MALGLGDLERPDSAAALSPAGPSHESPFARLALGLGDLDCDGILKLPLDGLLVSWCTLPPGVWKEILAGLAAGVWVLGFEPKHLVSTLAGVQRAT